MPRGWNAVAMGGSKMYLSILVSAQATTTHARQLCVMFLLEFSTVRARARTTAQTRANFKKKTGDWPWASSCEHPDVWRNGSSSQAKHNSSAIALMIFCYRLRCTFKVFHKFISWFLKRPHLNKAMDIRVKKSVDFGECGRTSMLRDIRVRYDREVTGNCLAF